MTLVVHPVTPDRWADVADLFSRRGPRGGRRNSPAYGRWCMRDSRLAGALLDAAVEHACARGASAVEAYPHVADGSDYMGPLALYERAGFAKVRDANKRAIVRLGR